MFKKNIYILLLVFAPIQLLGSDSRKNELCDNGILGMGFVSKDDKAQRREKILDNIRREHDCIISSPDIVSAELGGISFLSGIVFGLIKSLKQIFTETDKTSDAEKFICKPVIEGVFTAPSDMVSFLGGSVQFRSKLHNLREKLDDVHQTQEDEKNYLPYDESNELFGSKDYLVKNPSGIIVKYTDNQLVRISYDQQKNHCEYSVKKKKSFAEYF